MDEISVYILKSFPFSRNGIKEEQANEGQTIDIPGALFEGLNREAYVRRADIGDGHFALNPETPATAETPPADAPTQEVKAVESPPAAVDDQPTEPPAPPAPQPASATADLSEEELAALADGSWKDWRFFKQRSVAAKISEKPIKDGDDARAAIEAFIAPQE